MKAKDVLCKSCLVGRGKCLPEDEGPFYIYCQHCGEETKVWAYAREAWAEWKLHNTTATSANKEGEL